MADANASTLLEPKRTTRKSASMAATSTTPAVAPADAGDTDVRPASPAPKKAKKSSVVEVGKTSAFMIDGDKPSTVDFASTFARRLTRMSIAKAHLSPVLSSDSSCGGSDSDSKKHLTSARKSAHKKFRRSLDADGGDQKSTAASATASRLRRSPATIGFALANKSASKIDFQKSKPARRSVAKAATSPGSSSCSSSSSESNSEGDSDFKNASATIPAALKMVRQSASRTVRSAKATSVRQLSAFKKGPPSDHGSDSDFQSLAVFAAKKEPLRQPAKARMSAARKADGDGRPSASASVVTIDWSQALEALETAVASPQKPQQSQDPDDDDDDDNDWEEVAEDDGDTRGNSGGGVEIIIGARAKSDPEAAARRRHERLLTENLHKVHFLVLVARCRLASSLADEPELRGVCLSGTPADLVDSVAAGPTIDDVRRFASFFVGRYPSAESEAACPRLLRAPLSLEAALRCAADGHVGPGAGDLRAVLAVCHLRACGPGVRCRLVGALRVLPIRQTKATLAQQAKVTETKAEGVEESDAQGTKLEEDRDDRRSFGSEADDFVAKPIRKRKSRGKKHSIEPGTSGQSANEASKRSAPVQKAVPQPPPPPLQPAPGLRRSSRAKAPPPLPPPPESASDMSSSDDESQKQSTGRLMEPTPANEPKPTTKKSSKPTAKKSPKRRKTSAALAKPSASEFWCEVLVETPEAAKDGARRRWVPFDCCSADVETSIASVDNADEIGRRAARPITYILAVGADSGVRDVTARYDADWCTKTRRVRAPPAWLAAALAGCCRPTDPGLDAAEEDRQVIEALLQRPVPTRPADFHGHPLYVLRRHLLKYEVIYPDEALPLGSVRPSNEAYYSRDCVHTCHTRETWLKEARVVRPGETPAKVVKSRLSAKQRLMGTGEPASVQLFGRWQTQPYEPPTAVDGRVPRNEHGNVDLYQPCMLPRGCVHLRLPGLAKVARRLGVDGVPAVTGWEFMGAGWARPVLEGLVVCAENRRLLIDAWLQERRLERERQVLARSQRAVGNWRRLAKGVLMRAAIHAKYMD